MRADVYTRIGRSDLADADLDEALTVGEQTGEVWTEAEVHRCKGELRRSEPGTAEPYFQRALTVSRAQQCKLFELRASVSLARLWREHGRRSEARALLAPIYSWFTEGFDLPDLVEARALLDELTAD